MYAICMFLGMYVCICIISGPVVGPGALKPSVGNGKESSRLLVQSLVFIIMCMYDIMCVGMYVCVCHTILHARKCVMLRNVIGESTCVVTLA